MSRSTLMALAAVLVLSGGVAVREASGSSVGITFQPISREATTADPNLNNKYQMLLRITVPPGYDWTNAEISIRRNPGNTGTVYNAPPPADTKAAPNPALWGLFPHAEFDTFVQGKDNSAADLVAGRAPQDGFGQPIGLGEDSVAPGAGGDPTVMVSVAWGNTRNTPPDDGTFTIGRFTLSSDFRGTFVGNAFSSEALGTPVPFAGVIPFIIPEPTALGMLPALGLVAFRRQRGGRRPADASPGGAPPAVA